MTILIINSGSSSLKYQLFKMPSEKPLCSGLVERIGSDGSFIKHKALTGENELITEQNGDIKDHSEALKKALDLLSESGIIESPDDIEAIGHRVVHGGEYFTDAALITAEVKRKIKELSGLAPLHNPVNLECIKVAEATFPDAKQVAVFDTAFHQTMPEYAFRYALPETYYVNKSIRAYGFHGSSHKYVTKKAIDWLDKPNAKIISIHLGNGCSITAVDSGKSIDTSMGFGPLSGLIMGTRSGDIDPSVLLHLLEEEGYSVDQVSSLLNKESGLKGLAGTNDMRDVRKMQQEGNRLAQLICNMYVYRIQKYIGAYAVVLKGIDAIIFTAGVGENDRFIRESVCENMEFLNIYFDKQKNLVSNNEIREINTSDSPVKILVVPTNEELEIAQQTFELLKS